MEFRISNHALRRMETRGIQEAIITQILDSPDTIQVQDHGATVFSKLVEENTKTYLYRVFVNTSKKPPLVVTVYKTSKIKKYGY